MGLPVAIPAATSAFGGAMAASTIAAPALMSAAAVAAPLSAAAFTGSFVPSLLTSGVGGGGLLSGISGAFSAIQPYGSLISGGLSAMQSIRQGSIMKNQYELQSLQALADMENKALNWELDNLDKLKKLKTVQAANIARAYAGGIDGLNSNIMLSTINEQEYGEDYKTSLLNMQNTLIEGKVMGDIYADTARTTMTGSILDAGAKLGEAAYLYGRLGGAPTAAG
jgi:hypothetical protein